MESEINAYDPIRQDSYESPQKNVCMCFCCTSEKAYTQIKKTNTKDILSDLLVYPEGPHIRDRLSHGEVLLNNVSVSLVNLFVCLYVFLCQKFIKDDYKDQPKNMCCVCDSICINMINTANSTKDTIHINRTKNFITLSVSISSKITTIFEDVLKTVNTKKTILINRTKNFGLSVSTLPLYSKITKNFEDASEYRQSIKRSSDSDVKHIGTTSFNNGTEKQEQTTLLWVGNCSSKKQEPVDKKQPTPTVHKTFSHFFQNIITYPFYFLKSFFEDHVSTGGNIPTEEKMCYEVLRLGSFIKFPSSTSAIKLSQAGFYFSGQDDETICFSCGLHYKNWNSSDQPLEVHRRLKPLCPFLNGTDTRNKPISDDLETCHIAEDAAGAELAAASSQTTAAAKENTTEALLCVDKNGSALQSTLVSSSSANDYTEQLNYENAVYPQYWNLKIRLNSFTNWPSYLNQTPTMLAEFGFFYAGYEDCVRCFYCGIGLKTWEPQDNPLEEHIRWRPSCKFIILIKGKDFVDQMLIRLNKSANGHSQTNNNTVPNTNDLTQQNSKGSAVEKAKEMGFSDKMIDSAIKSISEETGSQSFQLQTLLEKIISLQEESEKSSPSPGITQNRTAVNTPDNTKSSTKDPHSLDLINRQPQNTLVENGESGYYSMPAKLTAPSEGDRTRLLEENTRLRDEKKCTVCLDNLRNVLFLPCKHLCTCAECAASLQTCPICRAAIRGFVRASAGNLQK